VKGSRLDFDAVIFDLDGTLADTLDDIADAMNRVLVARGFTPHSPAAYKLMIGHGLRNLVGESLPPEQRGADTIAACLDEMIAGYREHCLDKTRLYEGVAELLDELRGRGVALAVLSNKADELTQRIVAALCEPGTFAAVVGARPGVPLKPDPAAALLVAEGLGVAPARIAYVGDSGVDMRTASGAGMIAVGVSWGFRSSAELIEGGALVVLDHPGELLATRR
jgi:phosphoglycolate phosphatase